MKILLSLLILLGLASCKTLENVKKGFETTVDSVSSSSIGSLDSSTRTIPGVSIGGESWNSYPAATDDPEQANQLLVLDSNAPETTFYFNDKKIAVGSFDVRVRIDSSQSYAITAHPKGYIAKEEFIKPPYNANVPLKFTFMLGDKTKRKKRR
ncbi:hypothetical protein TI05_13330 [Achromatium sp. WMS3]|nr:hypothetical protein TI05_13330 [Achromatium sp. WMS3]